MTTDTPSSRDEEIPTPIEQRSLLGRKITPSDKAQATKRKWVNGESDDFLKKQRAKYIPLSQSPVKHLARAYWIEILAIDNELKRRKENQNEV